MADPVAAYLKETAPVSSLPAVVVPPLKDLGPAMQALTPLQRRFVISWMGLGMHHGDATRAAVAAGVVGKNQRVRANQFLRNPRVLLAINEETIKYKGRMGWRGLAKVNELIDSDNENTAFAAAKFAVEMEGHSVQKSEVRHIHEIAELPTPELNRRIEEELQRIAAERAAQLPAPIEGEFQVVDAAAESSDLQVVEVNGADDDCASGAAVRLSAG